MATMPSRTLRKRTSPAKDKTFDANAQPEANDDVHALKASDLPHMELVFGFVGPTGIELDKVCGELKQQLKTLQYEAIEIRLSDLISIYLKADASFPNAYERIKTLMNRGTELREATGQADIVARLGMADIRKWRTERTGDYKKPASRVAYLVRSFKRPEEVELFRLVYGKAFTLISVYASKPNRSQFLKKLIAHSLGKDKHKAEEFAAELINRDHDEEDRKLGQKVGKTFPLADFFVTTESRVQLESNLKRLVGLTFGNPYISPTREEQSMFFAKAAALRSLDLSRQVGAAIVTQEGELLSTGCNEVPKFGGGLYWGEDEACDRDFERGQDANVLIKKEIVEDAFDRLKSKKLLIEQAQKRSSTDLAEDALFGKDGAYLKDSQLFDVIEFGRAVHAEMDAITQAARLGISLKGARLFCTTFPCHICARHIVSVGIKEVVFVEPYEKSRASDLFRDAINVEPAETSPDKVNFRAFVGVAPRRYIDFFESQGTRKTDQGKIKNIDDFNTPRLKRMVFTYTFAETLAIDEANAPQKLKAVKRSKQ